MNHIFYDTETTGIPKDGHDARIVQLAALLTDSEGEEISHMNVIIKPDGFVIPDGAAAVHGITTDHAMRHGLPIDKAIDCFHDLLTRANVVVAHNLPFDYGRYQREAVSGLGLPDLIMDKQTCCTMRKATPIVQCPPTERMKMYGRGNQFKYPNLQEAHQFFTGEQFEGAHDAMADVRACKTIFFIMKDRELAAA